MIESLKQHDGENNIEEVVKNDSEKQAGIENKEGVLNKMKIVSEAVHRLKNSLTELGLLDCATKSAYERYDR